MAISEKLFPVAWVTIFQNIWSTACMMTKSGVARFALILDLQVKV